MIAVRVREEVFAYLRKLPPEPRHALRQAIRDLAHERGDIRALSDELEGFCRLRVGSHRWVYEVLQSRLGEG